MDQKLESPMTPCAPSDLRDRLTSDKGLKVLMQIRTKVTLDNGDSEVGLWFGLNKQLREVKSKKFFSDDMTGEVEMSQINFLSGMSPIL